ncbi:MAG: ABC transporter permease subunit [Actinobacteria bacterium]|nr:ABC transporter permease subunit [Actinomycetota bacterium]
MWPDVRAESAVQLRRPANWLLLGVAAALTLTFGYAIPYAGGGSGSVPLSRLLPAHFAGTAIGGLPLFTGALALIFGVLVAGSDYGWQTWKTLLAQRPSRGAVLAGKVCTIAAGALILTVTLLALAAAASRVVAGIEGADAAWPAAGQILTDLGAGWLIAFMWAMLGVTLAIALRAVALPVGIGLVWMLAVQNLISALAAPLLDWVNAAQQWLPGPAAGSLVATLGGSEGTPGVTELASQTQSWLVLGAYLIVFTVPAAVLLARRDLT